MPREYVRAVLRARDRGRRGRGAGSAPGRRREAREWPGLIALSSA